jgi:arsenate reductase
MDFLRSQNVDTSFARSKSWEEFATPDAPRMDFVITVCDQAAGQACPIWPGQPISAHWGVRDPAAYMHSAEEAREVIREAFRVLLNRINQLVSLPIEKLDRASLQSNVRAIGKAAETENAKR